MAQEFRGLPPLKAKRVWWRGIRKLVAITALQHKLRLEEADQVPLSEIAELLAEPTLVRLRKAGVSNLAEISCLSMKDLLAIGLYQKQIVQIQCTLHAVGLDLLGESKKTEASV
jgi:hypothetical protein